MQQNWCRGVLTTTNGMAANTAIKMRVDFVSDCNGSLGSSSSFPDCGYSLVQWGQYAGKEQWPPSLFPLSGWFFYMVASQSAIITQLLLALCGDIESNPGPRREPKPDKAKIMQDKVESHDTKLEELESLIKSQSELIEELKAKQVELSSALDAKQVELQAVIAESKVQASKDLTDAKVALEQSQNEAKVSLAQDLEQLAKRATKGEERQTQQEKVTHELKDEISTLRTRLSGVDALGNQSEDTTTRVKELESTLEDINEKLWELDKSWKNNLVFYGIKLDAGADEHPSVTESKIRDVIAKHLHITREVPIVRVKRTTNGPEVRGCKPVTVYFEKWQDKDDILRKSQMLRGANIYISEDFSKRVKDQRQELQKFLKIVRTKRPNAKYSLQYDKLLVDNEVYMFNDLTGKVEQVGHGRGSPMNNTSDNSNHPMSAPSDRIRRRSSGKKRNLQKSYSTESSLNHMVPSSPVHPEVNRKLHGGDGSDSEGNSRNSSPVKTPRNRLGPTNGHGSPTKQPVMPKVQEEEVPSDEAAGAEEKKTDAPAEAVEAAEAAKAAEAAEAGGVAESAEPAEVAVNGNSQEKQAEEKEEEKHESNGQENGNANGITNNGNGGESSEDDIINDDYKVVAKFEGGALRKGNPDIPETIPE